MAKKKIENPAEVVAKLRLDFEKLTAKAETAIILSEIRSEVMNLLEQVVELKNKLCHQKNSEAELRELLRTETRLKNLQNNIRVKLGIANYSEKPFKKTTKKKKSKQFAN